MAEPSVLSQYGEMHLLRENICVHRLSNKTCYVLNHAYRGRVGATCTSMEALFGLVLLYESAVTLVTDDLLRSKLPKGFFHPNYSAVN